MIRIIALAGALIAAAIAAPVAAAEKHVLTFPAGGSFSIVSASITEGAPASILVVRCSPSVCGSKFSTWFSADRTFARATLRYGGSSLTLEDVRFFELHRTASSVEAVLHVTKVTQTGAQAGVDAPT